MMVQSLWRSINDGPILMKERNKPTKMPTKNIIYCEKHYHFVSTCSSCPADCFQCVLYIPIAFFCFFYTFTLKRTSHWTRKHCHQQTRHCMTRSRTSDDYSISCDKPVTNRRNETDEIGWQTRALEDTAIYFESCHDLHGPSSCSICYSAFYSNLQSLLRLEYVVTWLAWSSQK